MDLKLIHHEYFHTREWQKITYKGYPLYKFPADIVTYQQLIHDVKPEIIIETGTCEGGSSLYFYDTMILCGIKDPLVITVDIKDINVTPEHPNIIKLLGSCLDEDIIKYIETNIKDKKVLVSLDSDHSKNHVYNELNIYNKFVSLNSYIVVEDTFLGHYGSPGNPRFTQEAEGTPKDAVDLFLKENNNFYIDTTYNKVISMNPNGYLRKRYA